MSIKHPRSAVAIRSHRLKLGLTQERLAEHAGIGRRYLIKLERGEHAPSVAVRDRLAQALGVDPSVIPAHTPPPHPTEL